MSRDAFDRMPVFVERETFRSERDSLINPDIAADLAGFADYNSGSVVGEEMVVDFRAGMDIDSVTGVRGLGDYSGYQLDTELVKLMGKAVIGHGANAWIAIYRLAVRFGSRIGHVSRLDMVRGVSGFPEGP